MTTTIEISVRRELIDKSVIYDRYPQKNIKRDFGLQRKEVLMPSLPIVLRSVK